MAEEKLRNKGGRPAGSRNKATLGIRQAMARLERDGYDGDKNVRLRPDLWLLVLQQIGMDPEREPSARISALRTLMNYKWGLPKASIDITETHELGESAVALLLRIQQSDQHRKALEELETMRRRALPSATIPEDVPIDVEDAAS